MREGKECEEGKGKGGRGRTMRKGMEREEGEREGM